MSIDWITVTAQIVNFLVLVWLLKRFLYRPILKAMDKRQQDIATRLKQAREREEEAGRQEEAFKKRRQDLEEQKDQLIGEAREKAKSEYQQLLEQVRQQVDRQREQWQAELQREQQQYLDSLSRQGAQTLLDTCRKILGDLSGAALENLIIERFSERLQSTPEEERKQLLPAGDTALQVTTSMTPDDNQLDHLKSQLAQLFPDRQLAFSHSPELVCGIELRSADKKVGWNIRDYLEELEQDMLKHLKGQP